jgi:hypothetical protein
MVIITSPIRRCSSGHARTRTRSRHSSRLNTLRGRCLAHMNPKDDGQSAMGELKRTTDRTDDTDESLSVYPPIISFSPSKIRSSSSRDTFPIFLVSLFTDSVRIWLILTHDFFGSLTFSSSRVSGNAARCGWLVNATAMTVPERSLKTLWLSIRTGRRY